jgi:hypothetical protein
MNGKSLADFLDNLRRKGEKMDITNKQILEMLEAKN